MEKYLQECVDSVLAQTFTDYEIILVDDGSTDESSAMCDAYAKKYDFISVIHKKNGGQASARNVGTKSAKGEYIIYLDSDDFVMSDDFLTELNKKACDNPDLIFYKYVKFFDDAKEYGNCNFSYSEAMRQNSYANKITALVKGDAFYGMPWIKAIKKEIIFQNDNFFDENLICEDMDWNYDLILNSRNLVFIDKVFICYRQREKSVTKSFRLKNLTDFIYVLEKWSDKIQNETEDEQLKTALLGSLAKYYANLLIVYTRLKDKHKKAYKNRIKALSWLLKYSMSNRPRTIAKFYGTFGFGVTTLLLKIKDR